VYIAAHMPDAGENEDDDGKRFLRDLSKSGAIKKTADGFTYLDPGQFHEYFAAGLSAEQAAFPLERWYATRAKSQKVEVPGPSHCVYVSHPREVAALIEVTLLQFVSLSE
jgi:hypothetical protein